jgi:hypothetical protein
VFFPERGFDTVDYVADSRVLQRQKNNSTLFDFAILGFSLKSGTSTVLPGFGLK